MLYIRDSIKLLDPDSLTLGIEGSLPTFAFPHASLAQADRAHCIGENRSGTTLGGVLRVSSRAREGRIYFSMSYHCEI